MFVLVALLLVLLPPPSHSLPVPVALPSLCSSTCFPEGAAVCTPQGLQTCLPLTPSPCLTWTAPASCPDGTTCSAGRCRAKCASECAPAGATRCRANAVVTCADRDRDGCLEWGDPKTCGREDCVLGHCEPGCRNECSTPEATACDGDSLLACADVDGDRCLEWSDPVPCPEGFTCANGRCARACVPECSVEGALACDGPFAWRACGHADADRCLDWGPPQACEPGSTCAAGACAERCRSECTVLGATECRGEMLRTCGDANGDGCLEWSSATPCPEGTLCSAGECRTTCRSECPRADATVCDTGRLRTCGDVDGDGCLEWGSAVSCPRGRACANGACQAGGGVECTARGDRRCLGDAFQECAPSPDGRGLAWGTPVTCPARQFCANGRCAGACRDECTVQDERQCVAGAAWAACTDLDGDGCLEWSLPTACDGRSTCSGGRCRQRRASECAPSGATRCDAAHQGVQTCLDANDDGVLEWGTVAPCGLGRVCASGACVPQCVDECSGAGTVRCSGPFGVERCADRDGDGCLEWGSVVACPDGQRCAGGVCGRGCGGVCTNPAATACASDGRALLACRDLDDDGCLEWTSPEPCPSGATCSNGACGPRCLDECSEVGARRCAGPRSVFVCGDANADGCREWSDAEVCPSGLVCVDGACTRACRDECAKAWAESCDDAHTGVRTCSDLDGDGCLEWGSVVSCSRGRVCAEGDCVRACRDECGPVDASACTPSGLAARRCVDLNRDGCLEWGSTLPCPDGFTCQDGDCRPLPIPGTLRLSEVGPGEAGSEPFVELKGDPGLDLSEFSLRLEGGGGKGSATVPLAGRVPPNGFVVVGRAEAPTLQKGAVDVPADLPLAGLPLRLELRWRDVVADAVALSRDQREVRPAEGSALHLDGTVVAVGRGVNGDDTDDNAADWRAWPAATPGTWNGPANVRPLATLDCPTGVRAGRVAPFDGSRSADPDGRLGRWRFAFDDGVTVEGPIPRFERLFVSPGVHRLVLTVEDDAGARATTTCTIEVAP